ncbi:DNA cytosine methyltransferase [Erythrobacter sp. KMU-140]|uniref:DNA (cytosine-5-)-methyltransferase n=1 Tax=Erythrobacter rubeus TaxID=2760803 RepID=A0ABR8KPN1_9SPHN|nr:DNA cytosine methyltransferase [Erythrobacter rubeus]
MNVLALCAGVGGLDLGIRIARPDARGIAYVEREAHAAAILAARMEDGALHPAPVWSDLATFDAREWCGIVDCVTSGDPCQPNSVAGKRGGEADDRFLIDQVLRIVEECRPHRVFRENVPGNADGQLAAIVGPLEALGYRVAAGIFSAAEVGASHKRERLFIMADRIGDRYGRKNRSGESAGSKRAAQGARHQRERFRGIVERESADLANANGRQSSAGRKQCSGQFGFQSEGDGIGGGDAMAVAYRRVDRGRQQNTQRCTFKRNVAPGASGALADASEPGSQGCEQHRSCDHERDWADAHGSAAELRGAFFPPFAPSPGDPLWPAIVEAVPLVTPALPDVDAARYADLQAEALLGPEGESPEAQSLFRRVADGLAYRVDRLRACGNGVVPLAAAHAWQSLDALHAEARDRERAGEFV